MNYLGNYSEWEDRLDGFIENHGSKMLFGPILPLAVLTALGLIGLLPFELYFYPLITYLLWCIGWLVVMYKLGYQNYCH